MNERDIFIEAVQREDEAERSAFVDAACAGDPNLHQRVRQLLAQHTRKESFFLDEPASQLAAAAEMTASLNASGPQSWPGSSSCTGVEQPGAMIGPYKIREQIGEGGFGIVYVAEQVQPIRRKVALKLIKPGMDSKEIIARFEAERQAVALMDHPSVARVLDAGTTEAGHPYFVMELVRGVPITDFCGREKLSTHDRLRLFIDVCRAVQHAHQKGIIHRDIKPSNVLVTLHDGQPVPKVIDFGIAKALHQQLTETSVYTALGQMVGTPMYMSPEQAELSGLDVDTRSDVYSLGVLLYELLTGTTPFSRETLKSAGIEGMRRIIRETEPVKPSVRLSTWKNELGSSVFDQRRMEMQRLAVMLRGDLDWIVMKSLEKDRNRRYASAAELAEDVERHLQGQPVLAAAPNAVYRAKKLVLRHHRKLAAGTITLLALLTGLAVALVQRNAAIHARSLAEQRLHELRQQKDRSDSLLYAADVRLAARALEEGDAAQAMELLERHIPALGEPDRRGIEWTYLERLARGSSAGIRISMAPLYTICLSPDGKTLAAAGADGVIHILDSASVTEILAFDSRQVEVNGLSFSADGRILVSAGDDATIRLWSYSTGELKKTIAFGDSKVWQALLDHSGQYLLACGECSDVRVFSVETGNQLRSMQKHDRAVESIALSPDGLLLACASSDGRCSVWDWQQGNCLHLSAEKHQRISSIIFTADGRQVVDASIAGEVRVTEVHQWKKCWKFQLSDSVQGLAASSKPHEMAAVTRAGTVHWLDLATIRTASPDQFHESRQGATRLVHNGRGFGVCCADRQTVFSVGNDGYVRRTGFTDHSVTPLHRIDLPASKVCMTRDGNWIAGIHQSEIGLYHRVNDRLIHLPTMPTNTVYTSIGFSPDQKQMLATTSDGNLILVPVQRPDQPIIRALPDGIDTAVMQFSADGRRLLLASRSQDRLMILDYPSLVPVFQLPFYDGQSAAMTADGLHLVINKSRDLLIYDLHDGRVTAESENHHSEAVSILMFADDGRVLSGGGDRAIRIWDWRRQSSPQLIGLHNRGTPKDLCLSHDQPTLLSCDYRGDVVAWSLPARQKLFALVSRGSRFSSMSLAADDSILVLADEQGQVSWLSLQSESAAGRSDAGNGHDPQ